MEESGGAIGMPLSCFLDNCMGLSILNNSTGLSEDVNILQQSATALLSCHRLLRYVSLPPNIFIILITIIAYQLPINIVIKTFD